MHCELSLADDKSSMSPIRKFIHRLLEMMLLYTLILSPSVTLLSVSGISNWSLSRNGLYEMDLMKEDLKETWI